MICTSNVAELRKFIRNNPKVIKIKEGLRIHEDTVREGCIKLSYAMPYLNEQERHDRVEEIYKKIMPVMKKLSVKWVYTD